MGWEYCSDNAETIVICLMQYSCLQGCLLYRLWLGCLLNKSCALKGSLSALLWVLCEYVEEIQCPKHSKPKQLLSDLAVSITRVTRSPYQNHALFKIFKTGELRLTDQRCPPTFRKCKATQLSMNTSGEICTQLIKQLILKHGYHTINK